ncbi:MAG: DUF2721 domain-containing protein [Gammaproteobacteria bacterium]|nr:DUF2721 domain-containing protein [Gammaproteobacteria bacterium]MBT8151327.1 DUF2721 domain-containing protein [Gammaproteobacteria bacterium]NND39493.1 DUF2721 domain-containing protein [Pseudomonadales bacterium]NNM10700.1 DUF2721 domain-containing protein [Pseudomonadales bacterium]RZV55024.1 MAG: DUF2721 domain-containing protein [Pseudomonadales bacterium]
MNLFADTNAIAHTIQLAVAPVFLLAGIAGFLGVMSGRLGRIIDRERVIRRRLRGISDQAQRVSALREHKVLMQRARITNRAIGLCTSSALIVCALITTLFIDDMMSLGFQRIVAALFVIALLLLITALMLFLREIQLATRSIKSINASEQP